MKKLMFFFGMLLTWSTTEAQEEYETVYATGGSKEVNWPQIKKEADADKDGPGFFYGDCAQGVGSPNASSSLAAQGTKNYAPGNLNDDDPMTAWVEGKPGYGIGEWFRVTAPTVNTIYNGYQATTLVWKNNSRVKKFMVYMDNEPLCWVEMEDKMDAQRFDLPLEVDWNKMHDFKFVIAEVFKGLKYSDVAISHVDFVGCCVAEGTMIESEVAEIPVDKIAEGSVITVIDPTTGAITESAVTRVASVVHHNLLEVKTDAQTLLLTSDHQLYVKGIGFCSLSSLKLKLKFADYAALTGQFEVMTWDAGNQVPVFKKIQSVRRIDGDFKTYSIRGLAEGTSYLVNGFVTKTY